MPLIDGQFLTGNGSYRTIASTREEDLNMMLVTEQRVGCALFFDTEIFEKIGEECRNGWACVGHRVKLRLIGSSCV